jgi:hypothetical protein
VDRRRYVIAEKTGRKRRHGWIDREGRIAIPPRYESYAGAFCDGRGIYGKGLQMLGVIDSAGVEITPAIFTWAVPFSDGLAMASTSSDDEEQITGCIDESGRWVIEPKYRIIQEFRRGSSLSAALDISERWGFIDRSGEVRIEFRFEQIHRFSDGIAPVRVPGGKWSFIDEEEREKFPATFDGARPFSEGYAVVWIGDRPFLLTRDFARIALPPFPTVSGISEGLAAFATSRGEDSKWGAVNTSGEIVIAPVWDFIGGFHEGLSVAKRGDRYVYIDRMGKQAIKEEFRNAMDFRDELALVFTREGRRDVSGYIDREGNWIWKGPYF